MSPRTGPKPCLVCGADIPPSDRAFHNEMDGTYEHLSCADERFNCDQCFDRFPVEQAIVVPQPPPYQEQRYCSVACVVESAKPEEDD